MTRVDAIIIGGGPSGATAGLLLARAGWTVAVVEKAAFPRRKVCGEFISATTLPLLDEIGLGERYRALAGPEVRRVGLFAGDVALASPMPRISGGATWGRALRRDCLDTLLLDAAKRAGARVWQTWCVTGLSATEQGHRCTLAAREGVEEIAARVVIAAHGSWEQSALTLTRRPHATGDLLAFKARFKNCGLETDLMPLLIFPGGYGGMVTSDGGRTTLSCCIRRDELQRCRERHPRLPAAAAVLLHIRASCVGVDEVLRNAEVDDGWLAAGPIRPGIRRRYGDGIFYVGNAAGEAHPIVAEGISMAMQSAWLLCRHLVASQDEILNARALAATGRCYAAEWKKMFARRIHVAAVVAGATMRPQTRAAILPVLRQFPRILTFGARLSGKTAQLLPA